jgi:hypothetical protein
MSALERAYEEMRDRLGPIGVTVYSNSRTIHYKNTIPRYVKPYTTEEES